MTLPASSLPSAPTETFEGPLDLLLDEVRRQNIAIEQVALAPLVARYLAYMRAAASNNVNLDIEWVHMAATLIQWKSRSLLSVDPLGAPAADPIRDELVHLLSTHRRQAAEDLSRRQSVEDSRFSRETEVMEEFADPPFLSVWDLTQQARDLARWASEHRKDRTTWNQMVAVEQDDSTIAGMIEYLLEQVALADGPELDALRLLRAQATPSRRACLFLAILEVARDQKVGIMQTEHCGEIWLQKLPQE